MAGVKVPSPVNGCEGTGEQCRFGPLREHEVIKDDVVSTHQIALALLIADFHLHLRSYSGIKHVHTSKVEPAGYRFLQGLLDVAVTQAFALSQTVTVAGSVLTGPIGVQRS